jgi:hypothetical protein
MIDSDVLQSNRINVTCVFILLPVENVCLLVKLLLKVNIILACDTITAYNMNEIRRLNIVLYQTSAKVIKWIAHDPKEIHNFSCLSLSVLNTRRHTFSTGRKINTQVTLILFDCKTSESIIDRTYENWL